ncbi:putative late blight resistance protein homolog R1A-10 [Henckelia pumila]|uniref:putative late blight resistance protein homolog R1A-10 n=1 Tax=Henckelia pumila TaxID=405737 RepID=UPI003C6E488D
MAYAAVITLKLTLQQILLHPDTYSIPCEKKHIESFHEKLEFLQQFLEEYPYNKRNEKAISVETRIRDTAYEAEDFMDLHLNNLSDSMMGQIISIELMMEKVDSIIEEVAKIKEQMGLEIKQGRGSPMEEDTKTCKEPPNALSKDSSSSAKNLIMVGFDEYLMQIKDQLTGESSALEVISIVGMGGIGKTTLATYAYNDPSVLYKFDVRAWATLSQSYTRVRDILLAMLDSMKILTKEMYQESGDQLRLHVYHNLKHRRYLITIDDIWDTNAWDYLKMMFPDDRTGSRILLTTRIADVAAYASPPEAVHHISLLSDDQSWKLLCSKVFGDESCPLNLQEIGKTIAKNCRGLPLSVVVIGGLLSKVEKTQIVWQSVAKNVSSLVFSSDDQCADILRLSYNYLPQYLKPCFLYMGVFPKGHEIHVSKLTKLLVAEGFLRQGEGQFPEEVAQSCVEDLLDRSLLLMSKKDYEGKIKAFKIHDLLLDFCGKQAKDEKFLQITKSPANLHFRTVSESERRISIHRGEKFEFVYSCYVLDDSTSHVRSILCVGQCNIFSYLLLRFQLLKVLDATQTRFQYFPPQVLELVNLRYIALLCDGDIPASITKLCNLQTLIISGDRWRYSKNRLPMEIWLMVHLRHVKFDRVYLLDPCKANFDFYSKHLVLKDLQTLSGYGI